SRTARSATGARRDAIRRGVLDQRGPAARMGLRATHLGTRRPTRERAHARGPTDAAPRSRVPPVVPRRTRPLSDRPGAALPLAAALVPALLSSRCALRAPGDRCGRRDRRRPRAARDRLAPRATGFAG